MGRQNYDGSIVPMENNRNNINGMCTDSVHVRKILPKVSEVDFGGQKQRTKIAKNLLI